MDQGKTLLARCFQHIVFLLYILRIDANKIVLHVGQTQSPGPGLRNKKKIRKCESPVSRAMGVEKSGKAVSVTVHESEQVEIGILLVVKGDKDRFGKNYGMMLFYRFLGSFQDPQVRSLRIDLDQIQLSNRDIPPQKPINRLNPDIVLFGYGSGRKQIQQAVG